MAKKESVEFRMLTTEEFDRLSVREKADYLKKAVAAQKAITEEIDRALERMAKRDGQFGGQN